MSSLFTCFFYNRLLRSFVIIEVLNKSLSSKICFRLKLLIETDIQIYENRQTDFENAPIYESITEISEPE